MKKDTLKKRIADVKKNRQKEDKKAASRQTKEEKIQLKTK